MQRAKPWVMFAVLVLAALGALGAFVMASMQAVEAWPGPTGGRRMRLVRRRSEEPAKEAAG